MKGISALEDIALMLLMLLEEKGKIIDSSSKYLLSTYYVLGNCVGGSAMNTRDKIPVLMDFIFQREEYGNCVN